MADDALTAALQTLAEAEIVAFGGVGLMSRILPATEAFRTVDDAVARDGAALRPHLEWLAANGSAAGKVYGAVLMDRLDPSAAKAMWRSLSGDRSEISTFVGCVMNRETLADYAANQLSGAA